MVHKKIEGEGLRASPGYFLLSYKRNVIKEYMISHVTNSPFCWRMKRINPVHGVQSPSPSESGVAAALSGFNPVHNIAQYGADFPRFPHHVVPATRSFPHASAPQRIHPSAPLDCSETWKIYNASFYWYNGKWNLYQFFSNPVTNTCTPVPF